MTVLVGALTVGLILSLLALGVYISFRIFAFPDITADGSITLGACVTAILLTTDPMPARRALAVAAVAGLAGAAGLASLLYAEGRSLRVVLLAGLASALEGACF